MARFFVFLMLVAVLLVITVNPATAIGVSDFIAVADGSNDVLYNPAGLVYFHSDAVDLEHRFSGYNQAAFGWDDIFSYTVFTPSGTGSLFVAHNQDFLGGSVYTRDESFGYGYGWQPSDQLSMGMVAKFDTLGTYDKSSGRMEKLDSDNKLLVDIGTQLKVTDKLNFALVVHNLGIKDTSSGFNHQATFGAAYNFGKVIIATEIYDFLNEGGTSLDGSIIKLGGRLELSPGFRLHVIVESSDWSYSGQSLAAEILVSKNLSMGLSWAKAESKFIRDNTILASFGYRF